MHWLVATLRATRAIEVGVFTGYSSIATATALGPGGKLLACDPDERALAVARRCWDRAGVLDRVSQCGRGGVYASRMCGSRLLCGPDPLQGAGGLVPGSVRPFFSGACCCDCMLQEISGRCPADTPMAARMLVQSMQATLFGCLEEDMGPSMPGRLCRQCEASGLAVWWMSKILTLLHSGPCSPVRQHKPLLYWPQDRRACSSSSRDAGVAAERRRGRAIRLCVRGCRQARVHGVLRTAPAGVVGWWLGGGRGFGMHRTLMTLPVMIWESKIPAPIRHGSLTAKCVANRSHRRQLLSSPSYHCHSWSGLGV